MLLHFRLYAAMAVIGGAILFCGDIGIAEWTEPVCLVELNNFETGQPGTQPCISSDGLSIFYVRRVYELGPGDSFYILEARRDNLDEPFGSERVLTELGNAGDFIDNPWVSSDGLRLYYAVVDYISGKAERYIKMAVRNSPQDQWQEARTFHEIHSVNDIDSSPTLTEDELTLMWMSSRYLNPLEFSVHMATRASVAEPFSNVIEVTELNEIGAYNPHLSGDGLRVYFVAPRPDNGLNNIYRMTRASLDEPFGNIEHLDGVTGPDAGGSSPHLSPDEKTIYFHGARGSTLYESGIWVSYWIYDPYVAAVKSIEAAITGKRQLIASITSGLDKDREVLEALNELGETGDIDPEYIEAAKRHVFHAIKRQMKAIAELEKSIGEVEKALEELEGTGKPGKKPDKPVRKPKEPKAPLPR